MLAYIIRRLLYAIPILIGVNLLTFALFFMVNTPDDMARMHLGAKRVTPEAIAELESRARLRQAAVVQRGGGGRGQADRHHLLREVAEAVRLRLRPRRRRPRHRARDRPAHVAEPGDRVADVPGRPAGRDLSFALLLVFFRATYAGFLAAWCCASR